MTSARAVRILRPGGPEVLAIEPISVAAPGTGQVRVEVAAAGLNRADLLQRRGLYPAPPGVPADVPGLEFAGHVERVGDGVDDFSVGDRVMGIVGGGGMSTHVLTHHRELLHVPEGLGLNAAAAIPEAFLTAYDALFAQAGLSAGETVLVHAVGSGVGTAALQLAHVAGATVLGTSRTEPKLDRCAEIVPFTPVRVGDATFAEVVAELTGGRGADVVLDLVGGAYFQENLKSLAYRGRMVTIGLMGGVKAEIPLGVMLAKRLQLRGSVLRSRPAEEKAALARAFARRMLPLFGSDGPLTPVIDAVLPMSEVASAHVRMGENSTFGKIVLAWS